MQSKVILLLTILLGLTLVQCHPSINDAITCKHGEQEQPDPLFLDVEEDMSLTGDHNGRALASYPAMRMSAYYGRISSQSSSYYTYVSTKLVPPILSYFQAALKVKYPVSGALKISKSTTSMCGGATPSALYTGVVTDYYYVLSSTYDDNGGTIATSYACYLATGSKRPLIGITTLNRALLVATTDVLLHERNIICTMHELIHTFGFTTALYPNFLDSNGKPLKGHIKSATLDGRTTTVLNLPGLTSKIQNFFGCSSISGAYMENDIGTGTAGVHFEKRHFPFEAMSSGLIYQMAISEFTLAFLEGTGWYVADYDYADPYWFGKGEGCNFLTKSCTSSTFSFSEFCKSKVNSDPDCTNTGRGGGVCTDDALTNNCELYHPYIGYDCENTDSSDYARLPSIQTFGRGKGSKCFSGTLSSTSSSAARTTFCFKYTCSGTGASTRVTVGVGSASVVCSAKGTKTVSGYRGTINCPDPQTFCSTIGQKTCPRNCMGRGTCSNGVCVCKSGYAGSDCASPASTKTT